MSQEQGVLEFLEVPFRADPASFAVQATAGVILLIGPCPRCGDETMTSVPVGIVSPQARGIAIQDSRAPTGRYTTVMVCDCGRPHPGRPLTERGCGAYWYAEIEVPND